MQLEQQPQSDQHRLSKRQQYDSMIHAEAGPSSHAAAVHDAASIPSHPSYPFVSTLCDRYPAQSAPLFQTYLDLKHAAAWSELEPVELLPPSPPSPAAVPSIKGDTNRSDLSPSELIDATLSSYRSTLASHSLSPSSETGGWVAIRGRKHSSPPSSSASASASATANNDGPGATTTTTTAGDRLQTILPVHVSQQLSPRLFSNIFDILDHQQATRDPALPRLETQSLLLALMASDSTLVYYVLSRGLVKPVN
ncbi:uncharacterized protein PFL1_01600 [Pseudozyma flocculosa PF-1]|uniref:uncharacterized protein n=1 Tax=Pseudozyma flocculosa PF-1 TaxID=1277687 RepID=UPI0004560505|nr:uncharacterized protein PFL1_01600 [Pseudozyma flocculosa PF-1]EPQ30699.1 hypothetical protein PFL1_01600 [Pseudozyma flocculosa PF-1]